MSKTEFNNRVFGMVIVKAINSNYNADFTHQPRTLPDGIAYATDKALKYLVKNYLIKNYPDETIFYFKRLNENMNPLSLDETYQSIFGEYEKEKKEKKGKKDGDDGKVIRIKVLTNLLKCLDIRMFGATYAGETNISIHGPVQINHGVNRFPENYIFSEQIMSPFRNPGDKEKAEKEMTTLGTQSKLKEGHYVHHFSVNPKNIEDHCNRVNEKAKKEDHAYLSSDDIDKLKESLKAGATYYDSAAKAGTENELLLWVQLKKDSKLVLPNLTEQVIINRENNVIIDLGAVKELLEADHVKGQIEKVEVYYNSQITTVNNLPENCQVNAL